MSGTCPGDVPGGCRGSCGDGARLCPLSWGGDVVPVPQCEQGGEGRGSARLGSGFVPAGLGQGPAAVIICVTSRFPGTAGEQP